MSTVVFMLSTLPTIVDVVKRDYDLGEDNACGRGDGRPGRAGRHKGVPYVAVVHADGVRARFTPPNPARMIRPHVWPRCSNAEDCSRSFDFR